ncbi:MAG: hypothetical protein JXR58_03085 [Bacteroidales bacterium]|nr:hypothetical protein [Bacteroidales bacterium]
MRYAFLFALLFIFLFSFSQYNDNEGYGTRPDLRVFQFTLISPPLSTDLGKTTKRIYNISLNPFLGITGGVQGFELAGFLNFNKNHMHGLQIAGFGNINSGEVKGVQIAGFMNMGEESELYFQLAGFINASGDIKGIQIGGFMNSALKVRGFQMAGFINNANDFTGLQLGGFINVAKFVKGAQIAGFINVCDSIVGVPVGFINIVGNGGYSGFEISNSDGMNFFFSGKLGVKRLYNIYSLGKLKGANNRFSFGFGIGTEVSFSEKINLNIENTLHREMWTGIKKPENRFSSFIHVDNLNIWNQLRISFAYKLNNKFAIFAGPSFNISLKKAETIYANNLNMSPLNYFAENTNSNNNIVRYWFGYSTGIRF